MLEIDFSCLQGLGSKKLQQKEDRIKLNPLWVNNMKVVTRNVKIGLGNGQKKGRNKKPPWVFPLKSSV